MKTNIVLGVTGSIAAHKAADLASWLTKHGFTVRVVMTADAQRFITPLPFKTLSRQPVVTDLYDEDEGWQPTHIKLLIAPAMNGKMWQHPATQANVAMLKSRGAEFIGPDEGLLSCGYEGVGRLWPVEKIAQRAAELLR
jgi:phosphopantothenoylcysteine synthetase/decarboxylase